MYERAKRIACTRSKKTDADHSCTQKLTHIDVERTSTQTRWKAQITENEEPHVDTFEKKGLMCLKHRPKKKSLACDIRHRAQTVTVRAIDNGETAQCTQEEICAFAKYVYVQKEHPKQDATGDPIKRRKNYARLTTQVPASSVAKKSLRHRKAGARKAQRLAKKTGSPKKWWEMRMLPKAR